MRRCLLILLLFLAGCGGTSSDVDYKIALDPGFNALDLPARAAQMRAFTIELIETIGKEQGVKIALFDRNWDNLIWGLQQGDYQAIVTNMQPYLFYEKMYEFSKTYLMTGPTLVVPVGINVESLQQMNGKEIAVQRGSSSALILEKYPGIIQRTYESIPAALSDIIAGIVDGAILDTLTAAAYCSDLYRGQLKAAFPPMNDEGLRLACLHGKESALIRRFNEGLASLQKSGDYEKLLHKWGLEN